jgi:hypothetical protein
MKSFSPFFLNFRHGSKSVILAIFQKSADWLDWPYPVSAALHFRPWKYFSGKSFFFLINYKLKTPSAEMACFWVFRMRYVQAV